MKKFFKTRPPPRGHRFCGCGWAETRLSGATSSSGTLAKAKPDLRAVQPFPVFNPTTGRLEKPEVAVRREYYRDIAAPALPADGVVAREGVLDLTTKMSADGRLDWDVPPDDRIIYRFGHTTMGAAPAVPVGSHRVGVRRDEPGSD